MDITSAERMISNIALRSRARGPFRDLPPGPPEPPAAQLAQFILRPLPFLDRMARVYGPTFTLRFPGKMPVVSHYEPEAIRDIFQGPSEHLDAGPVNEVLQPLVGNNSILLLDGAKHMGQRRLLMPPFKGDRMKAYADIMAEVTANEVATWPDGVPFSLHHATQNIALDVIVRAVFGVHEGAQMDELRSLLTEALAFGTSPVLMTPFGQINLGSRSPWGRFLKVMGQVHRAIDDLIAEGRRMGVEGREDVLALLLSARHEDGSPMSNEEIHDELLTLLVAGHETTATALAWAGHRLVLHPDIQDRVIAEVREAFPGGEIDGVKVGSLPYLDGFCKETLRIHPIVPGVGRILREPLLVDGRMLPAGIMAGVSIYLSHFNPASWPDPERFDPERFIKKKISPFEFIPFGGGVRRCIGMAFALYEMRIALATMLATHRFAPGTAAPIRPVRRSVTLTPSDGMPIVARRG